MGHEQHGRRTRPVVVTLAVLLVLAGSLALVVGLRAQRHAPQPPASAAVPYSPSASLSLSAAPSRPAGTAAVPPAPAVSPRTRGPILAAATPTRLSIPAIGVTSTLLQLGLNPDRTVQVPPLSADSRAGWYRYSPTPTPGQLGPAVLLGHVDSAEYGPGVFFRLGALRPGDTVAVDRADHTEALIGMGAVFAGSARAPITAVVILFELTGEYSIILPLMTAIVLATGISHLISRDTIYTLKLRRRGVDLDESTTAPSFITGTAGDVMEPMDESIRESATLLDVAANLVRSPHGQLPVLDAQGRYRGVITAHTVADALADGSHDDAVIGDHVDFPQTVRADQHIDDALDVLENARGGVPVLDPSGAQVIGWLTHQAVLTAVRPTRRPAGDTDSGPI